MVCRRLVLRGGGVLIGPVGGRVSFLFCRRREGGGKGEGGSMERITYKISLAGLDFLFSGP